MIKGLDAQSTPSKQPWKARDKDSKGTGEKNSWVGSGYVSFLGGVSGPCWSCLSDSQ